MWTLTSQEVEQSFLSVGQMSPEPRMDREALGHQPVTVETAG